MSVHTDLAMEAVELCDGADENSGVRQQQQQLHGFAVTKVHITSSSAAERIGKPVGQYFTVDLGALFRRETDAFPRGCQAVADILTDLLPADLAAPILVVGLGNRAITPDAIGPCTAKNVLATRHLIQSTPDIFAAWRPTTVVAPGVLGQTGLEVGELVCGVLDKIKPAAVVAVDALAAVRLSRLTHTIQLADTGIVPGSGVGNARFALTQATLGIPVIAVGVPTVVAGATLAHEIQSQNPNADCEALQDLDSPVVVTTRDIDTEVADISRVIGYGINMALHPTLTLQDIDLFLS